MTYSSILNHRTMLQDANRNRLYEEAINQRVTSDSVVLDLGAGSGIHGLMAARPGAKVYLLEPATELDTARQVAAQNGLADKIICITDAIEQADIQEPVDIIISVFTGNFLLEEDLLPSLFFARDKFLAKNGTLIPDRAVMEVVPVTAPDDYKKYISSWSKAVHGLDYGLIRSYAANSLYYGDYHALADDFLAEPVEILELDFMQAVSADCDCSVTVTVTKSGECHGFVGWFKTRLGKKWLSTSPAAPATHWSQAFLPLDPPLQVTKGEAIQFELKRPEFGEWSWIVTCQESCQRHSTFLSEPLLPERLQKRADQFQAKLDEKGLVALQVMQRLDGGESTLSIAEDIAMEYPKLFPSTDRAKQFVIRLIEQYC